MVSFGSIRKISILLQAKYEVLLTGEVRNPVRMAVPRQDDRVAYFILIQVVQNAFAVSPVSVPSVLEYLIDQQSLSQEKALRHQLHGSYMVSLLFARD